MWGNQIRKMWTSRPRCSALALGLITVAFGSAILPVSAAYADTSTTTSTTTSLVPVSNNPGLNLTGSGAAWFVGVVVGVLVLLLFFPVVYTALATASTPRGQRRFLLKVMKGQKGKTPPTADDVAKIVEAYDKLEAESRSADQSPAGQSLTTSLLALATLALVGLALLLLFVSSSSDAIDLRKTIITALLSILASISGFYFGARTAQVSAAQAQSASDSSSAPKFLAEKPPTTVATNDDYTYDFLASGSPKPTYQLVDAPSWLTIDSAKGSISGKAPAAGTFSFSVVASNRVGSVKAGPFDVTIT